MVLECPEQPAALWGLWGTPGHGSLLAVSQSWGEAVTLTLRSQGQGLTPGGYAAFGFCRLPAAHLSPLSLLASLPSATGLNLMALRQQGEPVAPGDNLPGSPSLAPHPRISEIFSDQDPGFLDGHSFQSPPWG